MYMDEPVVYFNVQTKAVSFLQEALLPWSIQNCKADWSAIRVFCSTRMLMLNRVYCKEILTSCNIENQSDVNICITSRALSFRDNYWIKNVDSDETWDSVNLYRNVFSTDIAKTALTGKPCSVEIGDKLYTGELTGHGTRAKCFIRQDNNIFLVKVETPKEMAAEALSSLLLKYMDVDCAKYFSVLQDGVECIACKLDTSEDLELIPCRDVLLKNGDDMKIGSPSYQEFKQLDLINFLSMQVFDYLTLNTDRNRDNFGLCKKNGEVVGMYPLYDHDSCFKGLSENAHYFVTGVTFKSTIYYLYAEYVEQYIRYIKPKLRKLHDVMVKRGLALFNAYGLVDEFESFMSRLEYALSLGEDSVLSFLEGQERYI